MPALEVTPDQLERVVSPLGKVVASEKMTGGMFATTFKVRLEDGAEYIVKTAPSDTSSLLSYEHGIIGTERDVYALGAGRPALLMPQVVHTDFSREHVDGDVLIVSVLEGMPWNVLAEKSVVRWDEPVTERDRGAYFARLHTVIGPRFGYPALPTLQADSWATAFGLMLRAILDDAARWEVDLPLDDMWALFEQHEGELAVVTRPHLIHMDVWQANVFLDQNSRIIGMLDTERAIFGDPLLDFVGADQMGFAPLNLDQIEGYELQAASILEQARGGAEVDGLGFVPVDVAQYVADLQVPRGVPTRGELSNQEVRFLLYRMYYQALMIAEVAPRGYEGDWLVGHLGTLRSQLRLTMDALR